MLTQLSLHSYARSNLLISTLFTLALMCSSQFVFASSLVTIQFETLRSSNQETLIAFSGNPTKPGVVFIHGTPGSWTAFESYLSDPQLQRDFFLVSYDRPEWGSSKLLAGQNPNLFTTQVAAIEQILNRYPDKQWILIGHSLGASIAPKAALAAPESISGLLLLAGSLNPGLGKPRWYNHIANNVILKWLVPRKLRASNKEIMSLQSELNLMQDDLMDVSLDVRVTIIQGMRDRLVSPKNSQYVRDNWLNVFKQLSIIELEDEGHFLPWRQQELIIQELQKLATAD